MTWSNCRGWLPAITCQPSLSHTLFFLSGFIFPHHSFLYLTSTASHFFQPDQWFSSSVHTRARVCVCMCVYLSRSLSLMHIHTCTPNGAHFTAHCCHFLPFLQMTIIMETEMSSWGNQFLSQINLICLCVCVCSIQNEYSVFHWMYCGKIHL